MAYEEEADVMTSKFNGGILQIKRIHDQQEIINRASLNLKLFDIIIGLYNYEIKFNALRNLYNEVRPKCTKKEREEADGLEEGLILFIEEHPINFNKENLVTGKVIETEDKDSFKVFRKNLLIYERKVKDLLDIHQMNSPTSDDEDEGL